MTTTYLGTQRATDRSSSFSATSALIKSIMGTKGTITLVQVNAVHTTGLNPVGFVDATPLVHQQDGRGNITVHPTAYNLPYFRLQGGASAVICDPAVGDLGVALISSRDITKVKSTRAAAAPDSFRQFDPADGLYLGGYLNGTPTEYIWLTGNGVTLKTAGTFTVDAAAMQVNCAIMAAGNIDVTGSVQASGDVTAGAISLESHVHGGVEKGGSMTDAPEG